MYKRFKVGRNFSKPIATSIRKAVIQNRDRILLEIEETRELYELLQKWRSGTELTQLEKLKVRSQLIDICKAIPALAIFIMPFGGLVLIFLIKYLPLNLLPTAFTDINDTNIEE